MKEEDNKEIGNINILIAEDDYNLGVVLTDFLSLRGYIPTLCQDGKAALEVFRKEYFDLCILDVMMPKMDGFLLAKVIKEINPDIPIIFLTAKSLQEDLIKGFKLGCDDYITKPFSTEELNLRIKAVMKRCLYSGPSGGIEQQVVNIGSVEFDIGNMTLRIKDKEISLTRKEAELLKLLYENKNKVLKREVVANEIWKTNDYFIGRSIDVFVSRLRKYLSSESTISILNVHGIGFKFWVEGDTE